MLKMVSFTEFGYNDQIRDIINIEVKDGDKELPNLSVFTRMFGNDLDSDVKNIKRKIRSIPATAGRGAATMSRLYQRTGIAAVNAICSGELYRSITISGEVNGDSASFRVGTTKSDKGYFFAFNGRDAITVPDHFMIYRQKCKGQLRKRHHVEGADPRDWMKYSRDHLGNEFVHMINEAIGNAFQ